MRPLCIYHGACRDGFCAAWVVHRRFGDEMDFHAGYYGQPAPNVTDRDVIMVDFSYPRDTLENIAPVAKSLLILDHHKTAEEALRGFERPNTKIVFDMNRSGAGLAWDYYNPGKPRPALVEYVEDRDLWRKNLPNSDLFNAYVATLAFTFEAWDQAFTTEQQDICETGNPIAYGLIVGDGAHRKTEQYVREVRKNARRVLFEGYNVPLVNAPQVDISELLDSLVQGETFAMGWWQRGDGVFQYSLRSRGNFDVSELAKRFGGGGHRNAAGFQVPEMLHLMRCPSAAP